MYSWVSMFPVRQNGFTDQVLINMDAQDAQDFSGNGWLVFLSIRNPAPDHRRSQLLVQQRLVLVILSILCIHVQFLVLLDRSAPSRAPAVPKNSDAAFSLGVDHE